MLLPKNKWRDFKHVFVQSIQYDPSLSESAVPGQKAGKKKEMNY